MRPRSLGVMVTGALLMTASGYGQAPAPEAAGVAPGEYAILARNQDSWSYIVPLPLPHAE